MVGTPEHPGCMARALNELFQTMEQTATEFVFKGSHVQSSLQLFLNYKKVLQIKILVLNEIKCLLVCKLRPHYLAIQET